MSMTKGIRVKINGNSVPVSVGPERLAAKEDSNAYSRMTGIPTVFNVISIFE